MQTNNDGIDLLGIAPSYSKRLALLEIESSLQRAKQQSKQTAQTASTAYYNRALYQRFSRHSLVGEVPAVHFLEVCLIYLLTKGSIAPLVFDISGNFINGLLVLEPRF
jgi:hypothetical protein